MTAVSSTSGGRSGRSKLLANEHEDTPIVKRCAWVSTHPLYIAYHDHEWGVPQHDERILFEMLILEGLQAGLSWWTVLQKRQHYREVLDDFDPKTIAAYSPARIASWLQDPGVIRNRLKCQAIVHNARCYLRLLDEGVSLHAVVWALNNGEVLDQPWEHPQQVPVSSSLSDNLSAYLRQRGFKYVGTKVCYAYLQAVGVINDHLKCCISRIR